MRRLLRSVFVATSCLLVGSCTLTFTTQSDKDEVNSVVHFDYVDTDPPNQLYHAPLYENFETGNKDSYYPRPLEAYVEELISYSGYVERYITNTIASNNLDITFNALECRRTELVLPVLGEPPVKPPLPSYTIIQNDDKAMEDYIQDVIKWINDTRDFYDAALSDYEAAVSDYNEKCSIK